MPFQHPTQSFQESDSIFEESQWTDKNDRQLRLWGLHGQKQISDANVILLNASAVGCEVLKNIVLPGFGQFTIIDDKNVIEEDLGVNFFIRASDLGKNRAEAAMECLAELNPDVKGHFVNENPLKLFRENPEFFEKFNFVVASQLTLLQLRDLAKFLYEKNIPLIIVRSIGLIGYVRVIKRVHTVTEAKLDNSIDDLRLFEPWDDLVAFAKEQDLDSMNNNDHSHTPYPIILLHALAKWKETHETNFPSNRNEEEEFSYLIKCMRRPFLDETNFEEALKKAYYAYQKTNIPDEVLAIFHDSETLNLNSSSDDFFIMARALNYFVNNEGNGQLPVQGRVPDFHSDTERYIKMQDIYLRKSTSDMIIVKKYVQHILKELGRDINSISDLDIKEFCKNAYYLRIFRLPSLNDELDLKKMNLNTFFEHTWNEESPVAFYFLLRALDIYYETYNKYPGEEIIKEGTGILNDQEIQKLSEITKQIIQELGLTVASFEGDSQFDSNSSDKVWTRIDDFSREIVRYGGAELHNISALIGGVGGQELIKLCTHQRFPVTCFIYDGIHGTSVSLDI